jgi:3-phenylpropionate/cinnamic acid dioxygenase small subunit
VISDRDQIQNLLATYCRTYDSGDFQAYAELFRHGDIGSPQGLHSTVEEVADFHRRNCILYEGVPNTRHVITNIHIEVDDGGLTASGACYVTIFQAAPDFPLQVVFVGSYIDTFQKIDGRWWFKTRRAVPHLVGDLSKHGREFIPPTHKAQPAAAR